MKKVLIIVAFLMLISSVYADDCKIYSKQELFQFADHIFLAQLVSQNDSSIELSIHEVFKGSLGENQLVEINKKHSKNIRGNKSWLIYAIEKNEKLVISECGGTKGFEFPQNISNASSPDILQYLPLNKDILLGLENDWNGHALNELYYDIISLRQRKIINELSSLRNNELVTTSTNQKSDDKLDLQVLILIGLTLSNILVLILVINSTLRS